MKTYARVDSGVVIEIIKPMTYDDGAEIPIELRFTSNIVDSLVDVTDVDPMPSERWTYDHEKFSPPTVLAEV